MTAMDLPRVPSGRRCPVCAHESRAAIDQALLNGKSARTLAAQFGFFYTGRSGPHAGELVPDHKPIAAHRDKCMGEAWAAATKETKESAGRAIAERLRFLDDAVTEVLAEARLGDVVMAGDAPMLNADGQVMRVRNHRLMLSAVREGRANAEMMAKLSGAVPDEDQAGLDQVRAALQNPTARNMLAEVEALLAAEVEA